MQISTCTVLVVHGGGNGVLEVVYHGMIACGGCIILYIIIILGHVFGDVGCICMWQSVLAVVHFHASLSLVGLSTNVLSPFVSPFMNVAVYGSGGAFV